MYKSVSSPVALPENTGRGTVAAQAVTGETCIEPANAGAARFELIENEAPATPAEPANAGSGTVKSHEATGEAPATLADPANTGAATVEANDADGEPTIKNSVAVPRSIESSKTR